MSIIPFIRKSFATFLFNAPKNPLKFTHIGMQTALCANSGQSSLDQITVRT